MSHRVDPVEVLHAALLNSDQSIAAAARAIGRSPQVLYNKFSEAMPGNEVTAREALALADAIGTSLYAEAVAEYFGGVFFQAPSCAADDDDLMQDYLAIVNRMGELSRDLTEAREDGIIDPDEFARLQADGYATMAAIRRMLADLETMVREIPAATPPIQMRRTGPANGR